MDNNGGKANDINIEEVIRKNYNSIWIYIRCLARVSKDCANDITQDVFLVLVKKWDKLDKSNIRAWLYSVARAKIKEYFKSEKKQKGGANIVSLNDEDELDPDELIKYDSYFSDEESINQIKESILAVLLPEQREIYEEYFVKGKSYEDIMEQFSISGVSARGRINRIRKRLTKEIFKCVSIIAVTPVAVYLETVLYEVIFKER